MAYNPELDEILDLSNPLLDQGFAALHQQRISEQVSTEVDVTIPYPEVVSSPVAALTLEDSGTKATPDDEVIDLTDLEPEVPAVAEVIDLTDHALVDSVVAPSEQVVISGFSRARKVLSASIRDNVRQGYEFYQTWKNDKVRIPTIESVRSSRLVRGVGLTALGVIAFATVSAGVFTVQDKISAASRVVPDAVEPPIIDNVQEEATATTVSTTTSTTEAPTTTTTTPEQNVMLMEDLTMGESIGTFTISALCNEEFDIVPYNANENISMVGTGEAVIDRREVDETPNEGCDSLTNLINQKESDTGLEHMSRPEWIRWDTGNPDTGHVNFWQPVAGLAVQDNGMIFEVPGNKQTQYSASVLAVHGSTFSAGGADLGVLPLGATAELERIDGLSIDNYQLIDSFPVDPTIKAYQALRDYKKDGFERFIIIYHCSDENGITGSAEKRMVYVFAVPIND